MLQPNQGLIASHGWKPAALKLNPMRGKVIAVDVDLVVVDSLAPWLHWFEQKVGHAFRHEAWMYDLAPEMADQAREHGVVLDPMEFWSHPNLYDELTPMQGCWPKLMAWHDMGADIIFVSKCVPAHEASKRRMLYKYFPWAKGFISTGDKQFVKYDVIIDDNMDNIERCRDRNPNARHFMLTQVASRTFSKVPGYLEHECAVSHWNDLPMSL